MARAAHPLLLVVIPLILLFTGCGEPPMRVTGTVLLDGAPLADAIVSFVPVNYKAMSMTAVTDAQGKFVFDNERAVAIEPGDYKVRISTFRAPIPDDEPPYPGAPERVPTQYNTHSTLKETVVEGSNEMKFELESSGEIVQPQIEPNQY